jgi:NAD(P)-dependent dehydrogenase (short-subunit alcohol dehydrogenase family)
MAMTKDPFSVRDKVVIVTGGLGQLGRQFSLALAERGARVAIFDSRVTAACVAECFGTPLRGDRLMFVAVDVRRRDSIQVGLNEVIGAWGVPDALVNNAALDAPPDAPAEENGPFETYPERSLDEVLGVNVKGVLLCCQAMGGEMARAGRGSIVNINSIYGLVSPDQRVYEYRRQAGQPFFKPVGYSISKSALLNLTRYLATYWADRSVRVNTLTLGGVFNAQDERFLAGYCARVPLGRMAREDEYNGAIVFLVSDASSYMTGANLVIDGGWTAW